MKGRLILAGIFAFLVSGGVGFPYVVGNWWPDGDDIVMDDVLLPAATWSSPGQFQMSEWNEVDTTDNSHPLRINLNPQFSFGANDGDNTIGFLGEAGLNSEYGLSYSNALAWAVCWSGFFSGRYDECDVMLDSALPWSLGPDNDEWFQSTVLHELGHVRGLQHYNNYLSIENSGVSKYLRDETLYMDDKVGVRQNASHVSERDLVMYNKWHDGSAPRWMSMSPTTLREGETVNLSDITVENRGTLSFSAVRLGIYLSDNATISTGDQLLNTGSFSSFATFSFSTFDWSAQIPTINDCGTRYIGGIIDDDNAYAERYEGNNAVAFTNGLPFTGSSYTPTPLTLRLARDAFEPNDSRASASIVSLPFARSNLSIDTDAENDFFTFTVGTSGTLNVSALFTHSLGDVDLFLLDSSGSILASSAGAANNESIQRAVTPGTYTVQVVGFGAGSCNRYSLNIQLTPTGTAQNPDTTGVFRPSNGALYLKNQNTSGFADVLLTYGLPGDYPVAGDWNGDGVDTIGVYRNGTFHLRNSNTNGFADIAVSFGAAGDQPVVGDWNGDGIDTIGIFRNGTFYLRNSNTTGTADLTFTLGSAGDVGIAGDWNGDGVTTAGVFRPSNGALYLKNSNSTGFAEIVLTYGLPGDKPVTGDWNGDGVDTIGVYRGGTFYLRNSNTNGFADLAFSLGVNGDMPIAGDWNGLP